MRMLSFMMLMACTTNFTPSFPIVSLNRIMADFAPCPANGIFRMV